MKLIRKAERKEFKNSSDCIAYEYVIEDKAINSAVVILTGRYPTEGMVVNQKCKELCYIIKGSGKLVTEQKEIKFSKGDMIFLEPGEKYYWEAKATILSSCTPAWYPEQHAHIK